MTDSEQRSSGTAGPAKKARRAERWIYGGAAALSMGILTSLVAWDDLAAQLTLGGFLAAVFGLHQLGRSGPSSVSNHQS